jgi:ribonuclease J
LDEDRSGASPEDRGAGDGSGAPVSIVALGGLGEIGMNCLVLEQDGDLVLVDCGVTFPSTDLGIDLYHPRFDHLIERADRVRAVVVTHGHEDHIGALPYLLDGIERARERAGHPPRPLPVWGPPHALELARGRLVEHGFAADELDLRVTRPRAIHDIGPFAIEPLRVTHSIADATALAIRTKAGLVIHTGDFKLDPTPPDGELTDEARFAELGQEGVRLLMSDSTNVDSPGRSGSEQAVGEALAERVLAARQRVVIAMFASNVQRLTMIGDIAQRSGRRLCLLGRSVGQHARAAQTLDRIRWPSDLVVPPEVAATMPRNLVLIVASGTQAERGAALTRIAAGTHPVLRLDPGDTVILSSRIIPGNDRPVFDMMGNLLRLGVDLVSRVTDPRVHASGHAHRDEQLRMIELTQPRAFVPLHGTLHHLTRHAALARDAGVDDVMVVENGQRFTLGNAGRLTRAGGVPSGRVATFGGDPLSDELLRERAMIGRAGVVFVSIVLDRRAELAAPPQIAARGVLEGLDPDIVRRVGKAVVRVVGDADDRARSSDGALTDIVRLGARRALETDTGRRPIVIVAISRL